MKRDLNSNDYATIGNIGKMAGPTRESQNIKDNEIVKMKEVWQKTKIVKQLKDSLSSKLKMTVDEDRLDKVLNSA